MNGQVNLYESFQEVSNQVKKQISLNNDFQNNGVGLVLDISITKTILYLIELSRKKLLFRTAILNPKYIDFDCNNNINTELLIEAINQEIKKVCKKYKIKEIDEALIIVNSNIQKYIENIFLTGTELKSIKTLRLFPSIKRNEFVKLNENENYSLFFDVGTTGVIALGNREGISIYHLDSEEAFESGKIKCCMPRIKGAIDNFLFYENELLYTTIGNKKPKGISFSGILKLMELLVKMELINHEGILKETFYINTNIFVTQNDVFRLNEYKKTIKDSIYMLLELKNINIDQVDTLYLAGGFGLHINKESLPYINLIPGIMKEKVKLSGNANAVDGIINLITKFDIDSRDINILNLTKINS